MANIDLVIEVAKSLGPLLDDVVFVGGCAVALIVDDPGAAEPRPTNDVDVISAVANIDEYRDLETELGKLGFKDGGPPRCRWKVHGVVVDIMPVEEKVLGFSSRWYPETYNSPLSKACRESDYALRIPPRFWRPSSMPSATRETSGNARTTT